MKITIKSIKQVPYDVEVPSEETKVLELKAIIENTHNFDKSALKLLFNGTLLDDNKSLKDYSIKEGMSIIMMNVKAKPVNVNTSQSVASNEEKKESTEKVTQSNQIKPETKPVEKPVTQEKDYSKEVKQLTEMGFSAEEAKNAIKAAKGNIEIAIEFLYNGIPNANDFDVPEDEMMDMGEGQENDPSKVLKNIASMVKIVSQGNPSQIQNVLVQLQQNNPEVFELITENEEEFRNLLSKPLSQEDVENFQRFQQQSGGLSGGESEQGNGNGNSSNETIRLSKPDYEAVQRLKALGFSEMDAVQAYFAFEKNEEMAANFLYETKFQDGDDYGGNSNNDIK
jgi:UV excision repair protein RAD23